jgi:hypothetical protein
MNLLVVMAPKLLDALPNVPYCLTDPAVRDTSCSEARTPTGRVVRRS